MWAFSSVIYWDKIYLISNSLATLPLDKLNLPEDQIHDEYNEEKLFEILRSETRHAYTTNAQVIKYYMEEWRSRFKATNI